MSTLLNQKNFFLIAGPCAIENKDIAYEVAEKVSSLCKDRDIPYVFKGSYRKANRTKINSFTGIGDKKALEILKSVKTHFDLPITTDIHETGEVDMVAEVADILQIPAFLCRQTDLIIKAAETGRIITIKKGQFANVEAMKFAAEKVVAQGNSDVAIIERGNTFGYTDLVVDFRNIPQLKSMGLPVILDCTHSLQRPNQASGVTSGQPALIETIASAGVATKVDGLFLETHPNPSKSLSDGANMLPLDQLEELLDKLVKIRAAVI